MCVYNFCIISYLNLKNFFFYFLYKQFSISNFFAFHSPYISPEQHQQHHVKHAANLSEFKSNDVGGKKTNTLTYLRYSYNYLCTRALKFSTPQDIEQSETV